MSYFGFSRPSTHKELTHAESHANCPEHRWYASRMAGGRHELMILSLEPLAVGQYAELTQT
jgi:hypothetical protein